MAVFDGEGNSWVSDGKGNVVMLEDAFGRINPAGVEILGQQFVEVSQRDAQALDPSQPILPIDVKDRRQAARELEQTGNQIRNLAKSMKPAP
jgi:hypothetical protein